MIASAPSLRSRPVTAAARSWYAPGLTAEGKVSVTGRLFDSSSRWNDRLSGGTVPHPGGGVSATCAVAAPRVRLVTVTVKCRGPAAAPSTGHTTRSGVLSTANGLVAKTGRRPSPTLWSRERELTSRAADHSSPPTG